MRDQRSLLVSVGLPIPRAVGLAEAELSSTAPLCVARLADLTAQPVPGDDWHTVTIVAASFARLRRGVVAFDAVGRARHVVLLVLEQMPAWWRLSMPASATTTLSTASQHLGFRADVTAKPGVAVRAIVRGLTAARPATSRRPTSGLRVGVGGPGSWAWSVDEPSAHLVRYADDAWTDLASSTPALDVLVGAGDSTGPVVRPADRLPPIDTAVVNPAGFRAGATEHKGEIVMAEGRLAVATPRATIRLERDALLTSTAINKLRSLSHVELRAVGDQLAPRQTAFLLAQLAAAGVPVVCGPLAAQVRELLGAGLVDELESVTATDVQDALHREAVSVRQRRAALRAHSLTAAWQSLRRELGLPGTQPSVSVVAVTRRPHFVAHLLHTIAAQRHVSRETVLVTHGFDADITAELSNDAVVTLVRGPDDATLGQLLDLGAAAASGDVIAKMDDDDWYGAHHLEDLLQAMTWSGATLVGAPNQHVYLSDLDVTVTRPRPTSPDVAAKYLAGPTLMIGREDLRAVGGWRPQPASVDLGLLRAVQESGGAVHRIHGLGFVLCRHGHGHTWPAQAGDFLSGAVDVAIGFRPPPEVAVTDGALDHYSNVRSATAPPLRQDQARNNDGSASIAAMSARNSEPS